MKFIALTVPFLCWLTFASATEDNQTKFERFKPGGNHVHPACVFLLLTTLADDRPLVASVDIQGCANTYRTEGVVKYLADGSVTFENSPLLGEGGYFKYICLGRTKNGISMIDTYYCSGGTGIFRTLLLAKVEEETFLNEGRQEMRLVLKSAGEIPLGDRAECVIAVGETNVSIFRQDKKEQRVDLRTR